MLTRRQFVRRSANVALGAGLLPVLARAASAAPIAPARAHGDHFFDWRELAPGMHAALNRTGDDMTLVGGNAVLAAGEGGALLIDTKQCVLGPALRREAQGLSPAIAQVINTHHHFDHAGGNPSFGPEIPITMHGKCWERLQNAGQANLAQFDAKIKALAESKLPECDAAAADAEKFKARIPSLPANAWADEKRVGRLSANAMMDVAGQKVEILHVGAGHTDNDLFIFFRKHNILVTGDLVFSGLNVYFDQQGGANSAGWLRSLRAMEKLCTDKTIVVPGHGDVGTVAAIRAQIEYFEKHIAAVEKAIAAKKSRDEVAAMTLPEFKDRPLAFALPMLMGGLYDERVPKAAPQAPERTPESPKLDPAKPSQPK